MKIELLAQDTKSGIIYDLSEVADKIEWATEIEEQPGKLTVSFVNEDGINIPNGSIITFKIDGIGVFYGYVFTNEHTDKLVTSLSCYDQLRYLKNKDTYVFPAMSSSALMSRICTDQKIRHKITNASSYTVPAKVQDNVAYYEMIQDALDMTLIKTGNWFIIRDNFGVLEHVSVNSLKTDLFIGDESLLSEYSYKSSIDEDTYNKVKLIQENKTSGKRDVYIAQDSGTIKQWGLLQYFDKMDEKSNPAQIKQQADMILKLKNRESRTLSLNCLGNLKVSAGAGIVLGVSNLKDKGLPINQYYIIKSCKHLFENDLHTMTMEMQVSV